MKPMVVAVAALVLVATGCGDGARRAGGRTSTATTASTGAVAPSTTSATTSSPTQTPAPVDMRCLLDPVTLGGRTGGTWHSATQADGCNYSEAHGATFSETVRTIPPGDTPASVLAFARSQCDPAHMQSVATKVRGTVVCLESDPTGTGSFIGAIVITPGAMHVFAALSPNKASADQIVLVLKKALTGM